MVLKRHEFATLRCRNSEALWFRGITVLLEFLVLVGVGAV